VLNGSPWKGEKMKPVKTGGGGGLSFTRHFTIRHVSEVSYFCPITHKFVGCGQGRVYSLGT